MSTTNNITPPTDKNIRDLDLLEKNVEYIICSTHDDSQLHKLEIDSLLKIIASRLALDVEFDIKIFFDNQNTQWETPHVYMWDSKTGLNNADFPGLPMTYIKDNFWKYKIAAANFDMLLFTDGKRTGYQQTGDFVLQSNHFYNLGGNCGRMEDDWLDL